MSRPATPTPWWRGAVLYQIYPRSFADANGDGVGDLAGITERLPYVASLGVDGIWLSPFYRSPMRDFGYDVSDYCDVDPVFGTLDDFDRLIARAHGLGLRVIVDQIYSHTSDQHPWFEQSRAERENERADWYVWADPKPDGSPPNNWQSVFGGPAWTWDARRCQYYLHNFLREQPQLNVHNLAVQEALLEVGRFWLERGADGFRLDAIDYALHDPALRDNPPLLERRRPRTRPVDYQQPRYNRAHPELPRFIGRIRALTDRYDAFTVAEVGGEQSESTMKMLTGGAARLLSAYGFNFLYARRLTPELVRASLEAWPEDPQTGWPSWAFSNHDAPRAVSRWGGPDAPAELAGTIMALLLSLRGNVFLYQGEELGLPQAVLDYADLKDPEAIANWPRTLGRDGARTPMPWSAHAGHAGFSTARPWLPIPEAHRARAVDLQEGDAASLLQLTRRLIALRHDTPALRSGTLRFLEASGPALLFERATPAQRVLCGFNLGAVPITLRAALGPGRILWASPGAESGNLPPGTAILFERAAS